MRSMLNPDQLDVRDRMGCDAEVDGGVFTITCTDCEGTLSTPEGLPCPTCSDRPGCELVHRCPRHYYDASIDRALSALSWARKGVLPVAGGYVDQSSSFLEFCQVFEAEISAVRAERVEKQRLKQKAVKKARGHG